MAVVYPTGSGVLICPTDTRYSSTDQASAEGFLELGAFEVSLALACEWLFNARTINYAWQTSEDSGGGSYIRTVQVDGVNYVAGQHPFPENEIFVTPLNPDLDGVIDLPSGLSGAPFYFSHNLAIPLTFFIHLGRCYAYITNMANPDVNYALDSSTFEVSNSSQTDTYTITELFYP